MLIKDSLLMGNVEYAIDLCLKIGRSSEAILIATSQVAPEGMLKKVTDQLMSTSEEPWFKNVST